MFYALIMYCSGICPANMPPPNGALFFTSLADCNAQMTSPAVLGAVFGRGGKLMRGTHMKQTCAIMYAEPKQLDRILDPQQLAKFLADQRK